MARKTTISRKMRCRFSCWALCREALESATVLRQVGEFEPARLGPEEMEYTTPGLVLERLKERFRPE